MHYPIVRREVPKLPVNVAEISPRVQTLRQPLHSRSYHSSPQISSTPQCKTVSFAPQSPMQLGYAHKSIQCTRSRAQHQGSPLNSSKSGLSSSQTLRKPAKSVQYPRQSVSGLNIVSNPESASSEVLITPVPASRVPKPSVSLSSNFKHTTRRCPRKPSTPKPPKLDHVLKQSTLRRNPHSTPPLKRVVKPTTRSALAAALKLKTPQCSSRKVQSPKPPESVSTPNKPLDMGCKPRIGLKPEVIAVQAPCCGRPDSSISMSMTQRKRPPPPPARGLRQRLKTAVVSHFPSFLDKSGRKPLAHEDSSSHRSLANKNLPAQQSLARKRAVTCAPKHSFIKPKPEALYEYEDVSTEPQRNTMNRRHSVKQAISFFESFPKGILPISVP